MGKILVIKGADFSKVAVGKVTPGEVTPVIPTITIDTSLNTATLSSKSGLDMYYTLDGTTPTTSSTRYTAAINLENSSTTIKAISYNGETSSAVAKITANFDASSNKLTLATTETGTIRYTDNGSTPTASSTAYSSAITTSTGKTYKAIVFNASSVAVSEEMSVQITA